MSEIRSIAGAYCPGNCDIAVEGKKIAGLSQHWFRNRHSVRCITTAASINVEERPKAFAGAINQFYRSAGSRSDAKRPPSPAFIDAPTPPKS
jgi:lipoate-protein ligase A